MHRLNVASGIFLSMALYSVGTPSYWRIYLPGIMLPRLISHGQPGSTRLVEVLRKPVFRLHDVKGARWGRRPSKY